MPLQVGDKAPDFALDSTAGGQVKLSDFQGKNNVLLAFYPLDFTPTCTAENCAFTEDYSQFESADSVVLPISVDSVPTHKAFQEKYGMKHQLLSDFKRAAASAYGVLIEERNFTQRAYFLIDKQGAIRWMHVESDLGNRRENSEILAEIAKLQ